MDLQNSPAIADLGVQVLSIAFDSAAEQAALARESGITVPMLVDADGAVSRAYDVLQWAAGTGEPGHTFILVNAEGAITWIRDYGAPENGGLMYVEVPELTAQIAAALGR